MAGDKLRLQNLRKLLKSLQAPADTIYRTLIISIDIGTTFSGYGDKFLVFFAIQGLRSY
jgi:hypothetical protein